MAVRNEFARVFEAYRNPMAAKVGVSTGLVEVDRKLVNGQQLCVRSLLFRHANDSRGILEGH